MFVQMTSEKELLLKDLCARLPYGVKVHYDMSADPSWDDDPIGDDNLRGFSCGFFELDCADGISVENIKPYLRPMSSMTEEEIKTYHSYCECDDGDFTGEILYFDTIESFDYLTSIHIDYHGLIPMGLALEAPEGMYKAEELK